MPEHASRFAGLYDQQNENRIADWGGDELFTRMPTPRAVDDAPAPRFRPQLELVDTPEDRRRKLWQLTELGLLLLEQMLAEIPDFGSLIAFTANPKSAIRNDHAAPGMEAA